MASHVPDVAALSALSPRAQSLLDRLKDFVHVRARARARAGGGGVRALMRRHRVAAAAMRDT